MANRRCISLDVLGNDSFLSMPPSAQALYSHLCLRSDDDGFCAKTRSIMAETGTNQEDLQMLIERKFVLEKKEKNVIIIKHWWIQNTIRIDTYKPSNYLSDVPELRIEENKSYTFDKKKGKKYTAGCIAMKTKSNQYDNGSLTEKQRNDNEKTTARYPNIDKLNKTKQNKTNINKTNIIDDSKEKDTTKHDYVKELLAKGIKLPQEEIDYYYEHGEFRW